MSLDAVAPLPPGLGLGWNAEAEQRHAQALARLERRLVSVSDTVRLPRELCLRHWMELEFQGEVPQCAGAAVTHAAQAHSWVVEGLDTTRQSIDLSMSFSWLAGRALDGTSPAEYDAGATISGVCLAAHTTGMVTEQQFPSIKDRRQWNARQLALINPAQLGQYSAMRIRGQAPVQSADHAEVVMGTGQGFIVFGVMWNEGWASVGNKPIESIPGGRSYGGHALALLGYTRTHNGTLYLTIANSHGPRWGEGGYQRIRADLWWQIMQTSPFGARVLSVTDEFYIRPFRGWKGVQG